LLSLERAFPPFFGLAGDFLFAGDAVPLISLAPNRSTVLGSACLVLALTAPVRVDRDLTFFARFPLVIGDAERGCGRFSGDFRTCSSFGFVLNLMLNVSMPPSSSPRSATLSTAPLNARRKPPSSLAPMRVMASASARVNGASACHPCTRSGREGSVHKCDRLDILHIKYGGRAIVFRRPDVAETGEFDSSKRRLDGREMGNARWILTLERIVKRYARTRGVTVSGSRVRRVRDGHACRTSLVTRRFRRQDIRVRELGEPDV